MIRQKSKLGMTAGILGIPFAIVIAIVLMTTDHWSLATFLLTPDQASHRHYQRGEYEKAAEHFTDPMWRGTALFKQGEFREAAGVFAGYDTADAAFNHGNALVMQGKYEEAVGRYDRALELNPGWEDATINREIAQARAEMLGREGGDMTGGKMEADEIVFSEGNPPPPVGDEQTDGGQQLSDAELRAVWLRHVQTKPADFLRAKFAYQHSRDEGRGPRGK